MKIIVSTLNILNQVTNLDGKPIEVSSVNLLEVIKFFKGEQSSITSSISKDNQIVNINNYSNYISQQLGVVLPANILNEYILDSTISDFDNIIQNKFIEIDVANNNASTLQSKLTSLTAGFNAEQLVSFNKIADTLIKIKLLDKEILNYQNQKSGKEDADIKLKENEVQKEVLEQKLASVQSLMEHEQSIEAQLAKSPVNSNLNSNINEIKERRIALRNEELISGFKTDKKDMFKEIEPIMHNRLKYPLLIAPIVLVVILTLIIFIFTFNIVSLLIGLLVAVVLGFGYIMLQVFSEEHSKPHTKERKEALRNEQLNTSDMGEDKDIINHAFHNALLAEQENLNLNIKKSLDNESYESVELKLQNTIKAIEEIKNPTNKDEQVISVDDYYKKRRELDILKIEKDNLEFSIELPAKPDDEYVDLLMSSQVSDNKLYLPVIVASKDRIFDEIIEKYNNIRQVIVLYESS